MATAASVWDSRGSLVFQRPDFVRAKAVFPNGMVEMLVNFGEPYRTITGSGPELLVTAWLAGLQSGPMVCEQPARQDVMGVRLHPAGAYALLARPMREMSEMVIDLEDLVGRVAGELADRCYSATSIEDRLRRAADWVTERVTKARGVDPAIAWAADRIEKAAARSPSPNCESDWDYRRPAWLRHFEIRSVSVQSFMPVSFVFAARQ